MNPRLRMALLHGFGAAAIIAAATVDLKPLDDLGKLIFKDPELSTLTRRNREGKPLLTREGLTRQVLGDRVPPLLDRPSTRER